MSPQRDNGNNEEAKYFDLKNRHPSVVPSARQEVCIASVSVPSTRVTHSFYVKLISKLNFSKKIFFKMFFIKLAIE